MLPFLTENGKRKLRRFSITCLPIAYRANASLSFVRFLNEKETKRKFSVCKRNKRVCPFMTVMLYSNSLQYMQYLTCCSVTYCTVYSYILYNTSSTLYMQYVMYIDAEQYSTCCTVRAMLYTKEIQSPCDKAGYH